MSGRCSRAGFGLITWRLYSCMCEAEMAEDSRTYAIAPPPGYSARLTVKSVNKMGLTETNIVKYVVFSFNLLFVITGVVILAIGATIQTAYKDYQIFIDSGYFSTPALLVAVGSIVLIIAFFGCCGAIKENYCMLITFVAFLVIVFILEIAAGISGYVLRSGTKDMLDTSLLVSIENYGKVGHNATSDLWDYMQSHLLCCGVGRTDDWVKNPLMRNGTLPISCCPLPAGVVGSFHCSTNTTVSTTPPYSLGCQPALGSVIEGHMGSVGAAALSVTAVQILAVFLAVRLAKALRNMKGTTLT